MWASKKEMIKMPVTTAYYFELHLLEYYNVQDKKRTPLLSIVYQSEHNSQSF